MLFAIVGIAAFQGYWFKNLYSLEWNELKRETDISFRDVLYKLQIQQFRKDSSFAGHGLPENLFVFNVLDSLKSKISATMPSPPAGSHMTISIRTDIRHDSASRDSVGAPPFFLKFFHTGDSVNSPLSIGQIDSAYKRELLKSKIDVPYVIQRLQGTEHDLDRPVPAGELKTSFLFVGLSKSYAYQARFDSPVRYILNRLKLPLCMGILLLAFTTAAFVFLYRNLRQQQQLAAIKNEFISNMTHELKTPISTVKVAVEALRHFDALDDPKKTREYLDISALELQRLSMLVDKVLKLSLFENKEIELNMSMVDLAELAAEVIASMRLQMEKAGAIVQLTISEGARTTGTGLGHAADGRFLVKIDRAHISSVLSNLLDNALKYRKESPAITVHLSFGTGVNIIVTDNGIGIPSAYIDRVFEKFFRVPSGDRHNIKGYGLGLSYVHHIITKHKGTITVESKESKGTVFTIKLPIA
jgi:two-component system phosphate regulon sensor histidine kinase PhoR